MKQILFDKEIELYFKNSWGEGGLTKGQSVLQTDYTQDGKKIAMAESPIQFVGCCSYLSNRKIDYRAYIFSEMLKVTEKESEEWLEDVKAMYPFDLTEIDRKITMQDVYQGHIIYLQRVMGSKEYALPLWKFFIEEFAATFDDHFEHFKANLLAVHNRLSIQKVKLTKGGTVSASDSEWMNPKSKESFIKGLKLAKGFKYLWTNRMDMNQKQKIYDIFTVLMSGILNPDTDFQFFRGNSHISNSVHQLYGLSYGVSGNNMFSPGMGYQYGINKKLPHSKLNIHGVKNFKNHDAVRVFSSPHNDVGQQNGSFTSRYLGPYYELTTVVQKNGTKDFLSRWLINTRKKYLKEFPKLKAEIGIHKILEVHLHEKGDYMQCLIPHTLIRAVWEEPAFIQSYLKLKEAFPRIDKYTLMFIASHYNQRSSYGSMCSYSANKTMAVYIDQKDETVKPLRLAVGQNESGVINYYTRMLTKSAKPNTTFLLREASSGYRDIQLKAIHNQLEKLLENYDKTQEKLKEVKKVND